MVPLVSVSCGELHRLRDGAGRAMHGLHDGEGREKHIVLAAADGSGASSKENNLLSNSTRAPEEEGAEQALPLTVLGPPGPEQSGPEEPVVADAAQRPCGLAVALLRALSAWPA